MSDLKFELHELLGRVEELEAQIEALGEGFLRQHDTIAELEKNQKVIAKGFKGVLEKQKTYINIQEELDQEITELKERLK